MADHPQTVRHIYVSTYCQHEQHDDCRLTCKFCEAPCACPCHTPEEQLRRLVQDLRERKISNGLREKLRARRR